MKSNIYAQPRTPVQSCYYELRLNSPPQFKLFATAQSKLPEFLGQYLLMNEVHRRLHPFQFVRPGDAVIHVGFDRVYLDKGQSHPLILSALVGDEGRVLAIDPDPRNTGALREYARRNGIQNIEVVDGAAWKEAATLEFIFDGEWSPMSTATDVMDDPTTQYIPGKGSTKASVQAQTLDALVLKHLPQRQVTYLSLTANGAEPEILEGAKRLLQSSPDLRVGIALAFRHFSYDIRKGVCDRLAEAGFKITVADAPHDPWIPAPFFFACAVKVPHDELVSMGFQQTDWASIENEAAAKEEKLATAKRLRSVPYPVAVARRLVRGLKRVLRP